jgi:DNA-binding response OmpR family regulator
MSTTKKIAVIEDDVDLLDLLKYNLEREAYQFAGLSSGKGALEFCRRERPDLLVLDIAVPYCDGLDICREIRSHPELAAVPIVFLTARASEADRILGLEIGGNDYLVKPFSIRELMARIKVHFRTDPAGGRPLSAGRLELDPVRCEVRLDGAPLTLTATEFRLLESLMRRPGVVFSRDQLLDAVWRDGRAVTDRTIDVFILRLRQKIERDPSNPELILSVRGFGYRFSDGADNRRSNRR